MLGHMYTDFKKSFFAAFAIKVVEGAHQGDAICIRAFNKPEATWLVTSLQSHRTLHLNCERLV